MVRSRSSLAQLNRRYGRSRRRYRRRSPLLPLLGFVLALALAAVAVWVMYQNFLVTPSAEFRVLGLDAEPLPGAMIEGPEGAVEASGESASAIIEFEPPGQIRVTAEGYYPAVFDVQAVPEDGPLYLQLEPRVLNGLVTTVDGTGVQGAVVTLGDRQVTTGSNGTFEILGAAPGTVDVTRPAWETVAADWDGSSGRFEVTMEPFMVRGMRIYSRSAGTPAEFDSLLEMAEASAINTLVLDTKEEGGTVLYDSQVEEAIEIGAVHSFYDVEEIIRKAKERGLYLITRIVTFQDGYRAPARPEHAVLNSQTGEIWRNYRDLGWMDPTDRASWDYPIDLAIEACELGFDEIQFDYVRFPSDGDISLMQFDVPVDAEVRVATIAGFLTAATEALHPLGCAVSADIFGIVMSVSDDQGLGQRIEELSHTVDALSPMVYPSHYSSGWLNLPNPNDAPGTVVAQALEAGIPKLEGGAIIRPWLQAFYYDAAQMAEQFDVADRLGVGYMLWNATSEFQQSWLPTEERYGE